MPGHGLKTFDQIYADQMASAYRGRALWEPNSVGLKVEIGDVGHIFEGRFIRIFNIHLSADDPGQSHRLPEHFAPLQIVSDCIHSGVLNRGPHWSRSVRAITVRTGTSVAWTPDVMGGFEFMCVQKNGAALYLPDDAERRDAVNIVDYRRYMLENIDRWCAMDYVESCGLKMEDLILVTGRDLAKSWLVAAFADDDSDASVQIGIQGPMGNSISVGASVFWQNARGAELHWGPGANVTISEPRAPAEATSRAPASTRPLTSTGPVEPLDRDQCVFVRGFRAKRRIPFVPWMKLEAAAEPQDPKEPQHGHEEPAGALVVASTPDPGDIEIEDISGSPKQQDLITSVLDYILDNSEADDIAIAHDDVLTPYLMDHEASTVEDVAKILAEDRLGVLLDPHVGSVVGVHVDLDSEFQFAVYAGRGEEPRCVPRLPDSETRIEGIQAFKPQAGDILILVMGPTGVGKSTFINVAAGARRTIVGNGVDPCTTTIEAVPVACPVDQNTRVVFIDTPGFPHTGVGDARTVEMVSDWLVTTYGQGVTLSGVVCMHRITHTQSLWEFRKTVPMILKLCGGIREQLALVMTNRTVTSPELAWWRGVQLQDKFKKDVSSSWFENTQRSAWEILDSLISPNERRVQRANKKFADQDRISLETITDVTLLESLEQARREFTKVMKELKDVEKSVGWIKIHQEDEYSPPQFQQDPIIVKLAQEDAMKRLLEAETQLEAVVDRLRDFPGADDTRW